MTPEEIAADRAIIDAATEEPWIEGEFGFEVDDATDPWNRTRVVTGDYDGTLRLSRPDAAFIAAARTRWPAALDEVERLLIALREIADTHEVGTFAHDRAHRALDGN